MIPTLHREPRPWFSSWRLPRRWTGLEGRRAKWHQETIPF
jgi:hypothetical protein